MWGKAGVGGQGWGLSGLMLGGVCLRCVPTQPSPFYTNNVFYPNQTIFLPPL